MSDQSPWPLSDGPDDLVTRSFQRDDMVSRAVFSRCGAFRYELGRVWDTGAAALAFVMLNPSTADETRNDPTVERCERRARATGFGGVIVVNLFAFRATDPGDMRRAADPIGPSNDRVLETRLPAKSIVVCAWGTHGAYLQRGAQVEALLRRKGHLLHHLGLSRAGHPKHPLYIPYSVEPMPWPAASP